MGAKPTLPQLRRKIEAAIANKKDFITAMKGNRNPQVLDMVLKAQAQVGAWEDVVDAMNGSGAALGIWAGK
jgi:predicted choloylglycine hydrolase